MNGTKNNKAEPERLTYWVLLDLLTLPFIYSKTLDYSTRFFLDAIDANIEGAEQWVLPIRDRRDLLPIIGVCVGVIRSSRAVLRLIVDSTATREPHCLERAGVAMVQGGVVTLFSATLGSQILRRLLCSKMSPFSFCTSILPISVVVGLGMHERWALASPAVKEAWWKEQRVRSALYVLFLESTLKISFMVTALSALGGDDHLSQYFSTPLLYIIPLLMLFEAAPQPDSPLPVYVRSLNALLLLGAVLRESTAITTNTDRLIAAIQPISSNTLLIGCSMTAALGLWVYYNCPTNNRDQALSLKPAKTTDGSFNDHSSPHMLHQFHSKKPQKLPIVTGKEPRTVPPLINKKVALNP